TREKKATSPSPACFFKSPANEGSETGRRRSIKRFDLPPLCRELPAATRGILKVKYVSFPQSSGPLSFVAESAQRGHREMLLLIWLQESPRVETKPRQASVRYGIEHAQRRAGSDILLGKVSGERTGFSVPCLPMMTNNQGGGTVKVTALPMIYTDEIAPRQRRVACQTLAPLSAVVVAEVVV
ncbi:hypothetical protein BaRGS_00021890, partial [Batillaria attramentaria]